MAMYTANLRKVRGRKAAMASRKRRRYTLTELLAQCNPKTRLTKGEREWLDNKPVSGELL